MSKSEDTPPIMEQGDSSSILGKYSLVYEVTALPNIFYCQLTKGDEPLHFDDFNISDELRTQVIEIRIGLYGEEGELIELSSEICPAYVKTVIGKLNTTPLRMLDSLLSTLIGKYKGK